MSANVLRFERRFDRGYALDPDAVAAAITPRTRLVILSSPHNPTGAVVTREALEAVGQIARRHGALVLVDEVYLDATIATASGPAGAAANMLPAARLDDVFVSTSSLTKSYGLTGLRCGWILSSPALAERLQRTRDVVDGTGPIVTERLGVLAFEHLDRLIGRARALLDTNGRLVRRFLHGRSELEWVDPAGGTVMFPRLRGVADTSAFAARLMDERGTAIVPGRFFEAPAHFRLGFGGTTETLKAGLDALGGALDQPARQD
jgi:aspartate/methionine/tyrosine aminotransferase